jgi:hypothetical protein
LKFRVSLRLLSRVSLGVRSRAHPAVPQSTGSMLVPLVLLRIERTALGHADLEAGVVPDQHVRPGADSVDRRIAGFVHNDVACLHHPPHSADGHLDVGKGIAFDGNHIGDIAWRDRTQRLLQAEHLRR